MLSYTLQVFVSSPKQEWLWHKIPCERVLFGSNLSRRGFLNFFPVRFNRQGQAMRGRGGGLGLTLVLLLLALVGKLAFLNLKALSPNRVALLGVGGGWGTEEGSKLREQLRSLEHVCIAVSYFV
jgi:hypothetical protein